MKNGKFAKRGVASKSMAMILALVLVVGCTVGGTLAYLMDTTASVTNTFTVGNIDIELAETTGTQYKMVPGNTITKDPKVTVKADSEASWVFVKVEEANNVDGFLTYGIADGWTELEANTGVYYREVAATTADTDFAVLKDNKVTVKSDVTKAMMDSLAESTYPKLVFTAYAIQKDNITNAAAAWAEVSKPTT